MRIGDIHLNHYTEFSKMFSNKNTDKASNQSARLSEAEVVRRAQLADPHHYGIPGMDITGKDPSEYRKIVDVSDDIRDKVVALAKKEFINNYDGSDGEEYSALSRNYVLTLPENERLSASWTLSEIYSQECARLREIVKSQYPDWQAGQPFDQELISKLASNRLDVKA